MRLALCILVFTHHSPLPQLAWPGFHEKILLAPSRKKPINHPNADITLANPQRQSLALCLNQVLAQTEADWLLWLEAGESLTPNTLAEIQALSNQVRGYCPIRILEIKTQFERLSPRLVEKHSQVCFTGPGEPQIQAPLNMRLKKPPAAQCPGLLSRRSSPHPLRHFWKQGMNTIEGNAKDVLRNHSLWLIDQLRFGKKNTLETLHQAIQNWQQQLNPETLGRLPEAERCCVESLHFYLAKAYDIKNAYTLWKRGQACFPDSPQLQYFLTLFHSLNRDFKGLQDSLLQLKHRLKQSTPYHRWLKLEQPNYLTYLQTVAAWFSNNSHIEISAAQASDSPPLSLRQALTRYCTLAETNQAPLEALRQQTKQFERILRGPHIFGSLDYHYLSYLLHYEAYPHPQQKEHLWKWGDTALKLKQIATAKRAFCRALENRMASLAKLHLIWDIYLQFLQRDIPGDIVELGCYQGNTTLLLHRLLRQFTPHKTLHVYDSFQGLPEKSIYETTSYYPAGSCATTMANFKATFAALEEPLPHIHPGWFSDTLPQQLPSQIGFAFLDGDFYTSIMESLQAVYPRLAPGAVVILDDYGSPALPGVAQACSEFLQTRKETVQTLTNRHESLAYIQKTTSV